MKPLIRKVNKDQIEVIGHFDSEILNAKMTLLAELFAIEHKDGYALFNIEDKEKILALNEKLEFDAIEIPSLNGTAWKLNGELTKPTSGAILAADGTVGKVWIDGNLYDLVNFGAARFMSVGLQITDSNNNAISYCYLKTTDTLYTSTGLTDGEGWYDFTNGSPYPKYTGNIYVFITSAYAANQASADDFETWLPANATEILYDLSNTEWVIKKPSEISLINTTNTSVSFDLQTVWSCGNYVSTNTFTNFNFNYGGRLIIQMPIDYPRLMIFDDTASKNLIYQADSSNQVPIGDVSSILSISGGTDVSNELLIAWLYENATQQIAPDIINNLHFGSKSITALYSGSLSVEKIYIGNKQVYGEERQTTFSITYNVTNGAFDVWDPDEMDFVSPPATIGIDDVIYLDFDVDLETYYISTATISVTNASYEFVLDKRYIEDGSLDAEDVCGPALKIYNPTGNVTINYTYVAKQGATSYSVTANCTHCSYIGPSTVYENELMDITVVESGGYEHKVTFTVTNASLIDEGNYTYLSENHYTKIMANPTNNMLITAEFAEIITFYVDNDEYEALSGMTWIEWVSSEFNVDGFTTDMEQVYDQYGSIIYVAYDEPVDATAVINSDGGTYTTNPEEPDEPEEPTLISFSIGGNSYQAEENMTWEEWVESEYNTAGYVINNDDSYVYSNNQWNYEVCIVTTAVLATDEIIENQSYSLYNPGENSGGGGK